MNITITLAGREVGLHQHDEAWVRVLHDDPSLREVGPLEAWEKIIPELSDTQRETLKDYILTCSGFNLSKPCAHYGEEELDDGSGEDEMEGHSLGEWFVFPKLRNP